MAGTPVINPMLRTSVRLENRPAPDCRALANVGQGQSHHGPLGGSERAFEGGQASHATRIENDNPIGPRRGGRVRPPQPRSSPTQRPQPEQISSATSSLSIVPRRPRSAVSSGDAALDVFINPSALKPLSKRAPSGYTNQITLAVVNILGGPAEISTHIKYYFENELSNDGLESGKIAESIALK
jgi:hypothetical protein